MNVSWQQNYEPSKLGQTDLVLVCDPSSSAGLCKQDYKSLQVVIMISVTVVNTETERLARNGTYLGRGGGGSSQQTRMASECGPIRSRGRGMNQVTDSPFTAVRHSDLPFTCSSEW